MIQLTSVCLLIGAFGIALNLSTGNRAAAFWAALYTLAQLVIFAQAVK